MNRRGIQSLIESLGGAAVVVLAWVLEHTDRWKLDGTTASALTVLICGLSSLYIGSRRA